MLTLLNALEQFLIVQESEYLLWVSRGTSSSTDLLPMRPINLRLETARPGLALGSGALIVSLSLWGHAEHTGSYGLTSSPLINCSCPVMRTQRSNATGTPSVAAKGRGPARGPTGRQRKSP